MLWYTLTLSIASPLQPMATEGLRARKKARTRQLIANCAAQLFAEQGYENVAVSDVAREADVAEQTVYNYFPTKAQLVTDRDDLVREKFAELIRSRPAGVTPAVVIRNFVLETPGMIRDIPPDQWRGEIGYLAAISPGHLGCPSRDCKAAGDSAGKRFPHHHRGSRRADPGRPKPGKDC